MQDIYILAGARTPVGVLQGALSDVSAIDITLMHELQRQHLKYGAASLCIGGGQGIAAIIENVA